MALGTVRFFYRRCLVLDSRLLIDALIETVTYLLFVVNDAAIYNLLMMAHKMQNTKQQRQLDDQMLKSVTLEDFKFNLVSEEQLA